MTIVQEEILGEYALIQCVEEDLFGRVFLASHSLTGRLFTLRILPKDVTTDPSFIERLEQEIRNRASWEHPSLPKIHTVSQAKGVYFIVSEKMANVKSLKDVLQERSFNEEEVLGILSQLASALDYIHAHGTWHGGLNLSHVFVQQEGESVKAFLADACLAKIVGEPRLIGMTYQALSQKLVGKEIVEAVSAFEESFPFLAPEYKKLENLSAALDVYAFGVLTYKLLIGAFPEVGLDLPSKRKHFHHHWDLLLTACLRGNPEERPKELVSFLKEALVGPETGSVYGFSLKPKIQAGELKRPSFEPDPGAIFQLETVVGKYTPQSLEEKQVKPLSTEMVIIPEGHYLRGSNTGSRDEQTRHAVFLSAFAIDKHPVSNEQFVLFLEAMGGEKDGNNNDMIRLRDSRIKRSGGKISIESGYAKHPVVGVSWYGALAYAKWVGKRLPTEAEWEVAAYGGKEDSIYPTGQEIERSQANFFSSDTTPVMSYPPNGYGIYDMAGNVYEWCEDWYDHHYYDLSVQEPHNPKGPLQGVYRVLRGGCWKSLKEDLRCAHRHRNNPGLMNGTYGFRCAADVC